MIEIFNFEGQQMLKQLMNPDSRKLDVTNLNSGFYIGIVTDVNGQKSQIKFIKE
jgi:hypothetical protein